MKITKYLFYALTFLTTTQSIICSIHKNSTFDEIIKYAKTEEGGNTLGSAFSKCTVLHQEIEDKDKVSENLKSVLDLLEDWKLAGFFYNLPDAVQKTISLKFIKDLKDKMGDKWKDIHGYAFSQCTVLHNEIINNKDKVSENLKSVLDLLEGSKLAGFFYNLPDAVQKTISLKFIKDLKDKMGDKWKDIHGYAFSQCTVLHNEIINNKDIVSDQLKEFLNLLEGWKIALFFYYLPKAVQEKITLLFIQDLIKIKKDIKGDAFSGCTVLHKEIEDHKDKVSDALKMFLNLLSGDKIAQFFNYLPKGVKEKITPEFIQDLKKKIGSYKFSQLDDNIFLTFSKEVQNKFQELRSAAQEEAAVLKIQSLYKGNKERAEFKKLKAAAAEEARKEAAIQEEARKEAAIQEEARKEATRQAAAEAAIQEATRQAAAEAAIQEEARKAIEAAKWSNRFKSYIANNKKKFFGISAAALGLSGLLLTKRGRGWMGRFLSQRMQ